jgi:dipeptidyl aminopeptidase/acylaminoacyl peptidase
VGLIVAAGFSMGGAPTLWLCNQEDRPVVACFTESTFENAQSFIDDFFRADTVERRLETEMNNLRLVRALTLPYLLMHGTLDAVVPVDHGENLWSVAEDGHGLNRAFFVEGAGHGNVAVPSYQGKNLTEYSHPDELPAFLREEFDQGYKKRIVDFVVDVLK